MSQDNQLTGSPDNIVDAVGTPTTASAPGEPSTGDTPVSEGDPGEPAANEAAIDKSHDKSDVPVVGSPALAPDRAEIAEVASPNHGAAEPVAPIIPAATEPHPEFPEDAPANLPGAHHHQPMSPGLRLVAFFKLFQGVFLASLGTGLIILFTGTNEDWALHKLAALEVDTTNPIAQHLFHGLDTMSPLKFKHVGLSAFVYSIVLIVEGTALLRRKTWAEYLTIGVTASFVPLEVYEVCVHFHVATLVVLALNLAVVVFLAYDLKRRQLRHAAHPTVVYDD